MQKKLILTAALLATKSLLAADIGIYNPKGAISTPKTCLMELQHPGGDGSPDYDELQKIFIDSSKDKGYDIVTTFSAEPDATFVLPSINSEQKKDPNKFLLSSIKGVFDGIDEFQDEKICPAGGTGVGAQIDIDIVPAGQESLDAYSYFKRSKPAVKQLSKVLCLKKGFSEAEKLEARKAAVRTIAKSIPTCEEFWTRSASVLKYHLYQTQNWRNPNLQALGKCKTIDGLDSVTIELFTLIDIKPSANLLVKVMANDEVVSTTASEPSNTIMYWPHDPTPYQIDLGYGYTKKDPTINNYTANGLFISKIDHNIEVDVKETVSDQRNIITGERSRKMLCDFEKDLFKINKRL